MGSIRDRGKRGRASSKDCVVFLHIPKTAGSTLSTALVMNYAPEHTIRLDLIDRPLADIEREVSPETLAHARLVRGHLSYGVHRYIPRPCHYITVLREPVARTISGYKFIIRNPAAFRHHALHDPEVGGKIGLEGYLESEGVGRKGNRQTRMLSGRYSGDLDRAALEEAKANLQDFLVVGLTERFEETFALMRRALRFRIPVYATKLVAPPLEVSGHAIDLIREQNELDRELYEFGCELFRSQVDAQGSSFALETAMFRAMRPVSRTIGKGRVERTLVKLSRRR